MSLKNKIPTLYKLFKSNYPKILLITILNIVYLIGIPFAVMWLGMLGMLADDDIQIIDNVVTVLHLVLIISLVISVLRFFKSVAGLSKLKMHLVYVLPIIIFIIEAILMRFII
jgi:hypothetical protein